MTQTPLYKRTAVYALTPQGIRLGRSIAEKSGGQLFVPDRLADVWSQGFESLPKLVATTFPKYGRHVFVTAAGIAVRCIAPVLQGKTVDPAVVVLDQKGRHVISLVSGHIGGANRLAEEVAAMTGGTAVITTATDTEGLEAIDVLARDKGLVIGNPQAIKTINSSILERRRIQVYDPEDWLGGLDVRVIPYHRVHEPGQWNPSTPGVWVDWRAGGEHPGTLRLYPPCLMVGVGCRKGTPVTEITGPVNAAFRDNGLALQSLAGIGSIEAKQDEPGLLEAAEHFGVPPVFFLAEELDGVPVLTPSEMVKMHMGVESVCEAAAILLSKGGKLEVPKIKYKRSTVAVARLLGPSEEDSPLSA